MDEKDLDQSIKTLNEQQKVLIAMYEQFAQEYLKILYNNQCQICGETIEISFGSFLSEVHHLSNSRLSPGLGNMIVVCPNHHVMFNRGAITIDIDKKIVIHCNSDNPLNNKQIQLKHEINRGYLEYHNNNIFINPIEPAEPQEDITIEIDTNNVQSVNFGNTVTIRDISTLEEFEIKLEEKFNRRFMRPIEKELYLKFKNDSILHDGFQYKIISIMTASDVTRRNLTREFGINPITIPRR